MLEYSFKRLFILSLGRLHNLLGENNLRALHLCGRYGCAIAGRGSHRSDQVREDLRATIYRFSG